jgi:cobalamin biosynthesis protein CobW
MKPVSVDIVTGFLGSGKTTLIAHAMRGVLSRPDVVFIVNEIGEIGLDGRVLTGFESVERLVELAGGCICCSIEDSRLDSAVRELVDRFDPALIVLETTGLADPRILEERVVLAGLRLDAIITVVDAENHLTRAASTRVGRSQVSTADFLVINKLDLCSVTEHARLRKQLRRRNPRAALFNAVRGEAQSDLLFGLGFRRYRPPNEGGTRPCASHLHSDGIGSVSLRTPGVLDRRRFERFLRRLPPSVLRAKGVVAFADTPWRCVFNYTCGRYELNWVQWPKAPAGSEAVFIGRQIESAEASLMQALTLCAPD